MSKRTLCANLIGTPCSGKSTIAAGLFHQLKIRSIDCELCSEVAKDCVWAEETMAFKDQLYLTGLQHYKQFVMMGKVDVLITDSSLLAGALYYPENDPVEHGLFSAYVVTKFNKFNNLNIRVRRTGAYNPVGRVHTEEQANALEAKLDKFLRTFGIPTIPIVTSDSAVSEVLMYTLASLCPGS